MLTYILFDNKILGEALVSIQVFAETCESRFRYCLVPETGGVVDERQYDWHNALEPTSRKKELAKSVNNENEVVRIVRALNPIPVLVWKELALGK